MNTVQAVSKMNPNGFKSCSKLSEYFADFIFPAPKVAFITVVTFHSGEARLNHILYLLYSRENNEKVTDSNLIIMIVAESH